ncbi:MAG: hypothetical protein ACI8S6_004339, partial [Myxococcota bacterium]
MRSLPPQLLRALAVGAASLAGATAASWPLARDAAVVFPSAPDMPDLHASMWLPIQIRTAIEGGHSLWWAPELLWPEGQSIALLIWNLLLSIAQLPLYAAFEPLQAYNLSLIGFAALGGAAAFSLGRRLGGPAGGLVAAALTLCSPYVWNELLQGRPEQGMLAGLLWTTAGLVSLHQDPAPTRRQGARVGLAWALTGLCYWFYGYFLLLIIGTLALVAVARRQRALLMALGVAAATAAAIAGPFAAALLWEAISSGSTYQRSTSPALLTQLHALSQGASLGVRHLIWPLSPPEHLRDILPLSALIAAVACLWGPARRRAGFLLPLAAAGLLLALGRQLQWAPGEPVMMGESALSMPFAWMQSLPGFGRLWWPYRMLSLFIVGAAGCA